MNPIELGTVIAVVCAAGLFILLERRVPYNATQPVFRKGFWNDLVWYALVQSYVMAVIIARIVGWLDARSGLSRLHLVSAWSILAQLIFFIVTHDLFIYLFHRLQHRSPMLWRLHEAHHSVRDVDWLAGARSHSLEILINQTIEFAPMVLLGASPVVIVLKGAVSAVWGMFIHSNLDVRLGRARYVLNGPEMHRWHHADDQRSYDHNFGTKLAIWDWLFGTAFLPDREKASRYGIADRAYPEEFPAGYFIQQAIPFRRDDQPGTSGADSLAVKS